MEDFPKEAAKEEIIRNQLRHVRLQIKHNMSVQTDLAPQKFYCSKAINTEEENKDSIQEIIINKTVHELEQWKQQQMESILNKLERKEIDYKNDVKKQWEQLRAEKFRELKVEMHRLRQTMHYKDSVFEIKNKELQIENSRLEKENADLNARNDVLINELKELQSLHLSADELLDFRNDLRKQSARIALVEKSRNNFKEHLIKTSHEINKLKLTCIELQQTAFANSMPKPNKSQTIKDKLNKEKYDKETKGSNDVRITFYVSSGSSTECNEVSGDSLPTNVSVADEKNRMDEIESVYFN
uniref:Uncharacterized protein n=1 Tax=Glossina brevipalpis TaxID=37001 RepID=A0A1A9WDF4_9MUSC